MIPYHFDSKLTVMAVLISKPGKEDILREALLAQGRRIYEEPGYIQFDLHQSIDDPLIFTLYEIWESPDMLQLHFRQEHTIKLVKQFDELLAQPLRVWHLSKILPDL